MNEPTFSVTCPHCGELMRVVHHPYLESGTASPKVIAEGVPRERGGSEGPFVPLIILQG